MSYAQVAHRYAKALYQLSNENGQLDDVAQSLVEIDKSLNPSTDFYHFIHNPLLPLDVRVKVIHALFSGKVVDSLERFILFINAKNRLDLLKDIIQAFDQLFLESKNSVRGVIKTAHEWPIEQQEMINHRLNDRFRKKVILNWQIDSTLIGGFKVIVNDQLIDFSYKSQLESYRDKVLN